METPEAARVVDPFADRASMVARLLLRSPDRTWGVRELADEAGTGLGSTSRVIRHLERWGHLRVDRAGRASVVGVADAMGLFTAWTSRYAWHQNAAVSFHAPIGSQPRFLDRLPSILGRVRWAFTLQSGASLVAPHTLGSERIHIYVDPAAGPLKEAGVRVGWRPAADGTVVLMNPYHKKSVWFDEQRCEGLPVVSTLQLALDLWHYPVRGREQAEHLLHTVAGWA
jgi:hypothetical protein